MNIRDRRGIREFAGARLENCREEKKIVLIYAALTLGLSALVTVVNYALGLRIDHLGGLSNFGTKTVLSTIQSMTPIALSLITMCVETGYLAAMLRIARGQYVSPNTLRLGFDRFWVLLRSSLFQGLMYTSVLFLSIYVGIMVFMVSPLSTEAVTVLSPYLTEVSALNPTLELPEAVYTQFAAAVWPAYVICGILFAAAAVPIWYGYRMVPYVIIDKPALGALAAMRASKLMMHRNRFQLFRLDLSMWWYYLALLAAQAFCYGDVILPLLGVALPGDEDLWYFVFLAVYMVILLAVYYFLRGRVEVSYGIAYDSIKPEEPRDGGVVLGNIFQM